MEAWETFKKTFGAIKIDYKYEEGQRYFIYGFRNDENFWDFENGELVYVTEDYNYITTFYFLHWD
ncbi:hypothetical protein [Rummeliibacillus sp. BSL5]